MTDLQETAVAASPAAAATPPGNAPAADSARAWRIYAALLFGAFVALEAAAFQGPAMAPIVRHFRIPVTLAALILQLYYMGATVFAPAMGRLSDKTGRKPMVMAGLAVFAAAEFMAAASTSFPMFLLARFVQGLGVACILPVVLIYVRQLFSEEKRGLSLGILAFAMSLGATTGALIGGMLIDRFGWPVIYVVSGTLALGGLCLVAACVPELPATSDRRSFDVKGVVLLFAAVGGLLAVPTLAANFGIAATPTMASLALGVAACLLLWRDQSRAAHPIVDTMLLRQRRFTLPALIYLLFLLCHAGAVYSLAFVVADRPDGNAKEVGLLMFFIYVSSAVVAPFAGKLTDRFDPRRVLFLAASGMVVVFALYAQIRVETPLWQVVAVGVMLGLLVGAKTPAIMKIALGTIPQEKLGTGLLTMLRDLGTPAGSSFALAAFGATVGARTEVALIEQAKEAGLGGEWVPALKTAAAAHGKQLDPALGNALAGVGKNFSELFSQATASAMAVAQPVVGYSLMGIMVLALVLVFLLPKGQRQHG